jgi:hypothetical protein
MKVMNLKITVQKILLVVIIVIGSFMQRPCRSETHEIANQTGVITNNPIVTKSVWFADEKHYQGDTDTNGLSCVLWISNAPVYSGQESPVCKILVNNTSTNILTCWAMYPNINTKIELLNSKGQPVEKKEAGKQYGTITNYEQLKKMVENRRVEWSSGRARTDGFIRILPGQDWGTVFSISELFELKEPGEYTLKARVCLIQRLAWEDRQPVLKFTRLPEVTAKIQLRPEDVTPENLLPSGQTNSPAK